MSYSKRKLTSESDDSTDDLILKDDQSPSPNGMLSTEPYLNYVVEVPHHTDVSKKKLKNRCLIAFIVILITLCVIFACLYFHEKGRNLKQEEEESRFCITPGCIDAAAFIRSAMEESTNPCEDFYVYSCGGWLAQNPIPDGKSAWSIDSVLWEKNQIMLRSVLQKSVNQSNLASKAEIKTYELFQSCMNQKEINKLGVAPVNQMLKNIGGFIVKETGKKADVSNANQLLTLLNNARRYAHFWPFSVIYISPDDKHSTKNVLKIQQNGLNLPMYRYKNNDTDKVVQAYIDYLTALGAKLNVSITKKEFRKMAVETYHYEKNLSQIFVPPKERSTVDQTYYPSTLGQLKKLVPNVDWRALVKDTFKVFKVNIDIEDSEPIIIETYQYFAKLSHLLNMTDLRVIQNHIMFRAAATYASFLTEDIILLSKNLTVAKFGVFKEQPRWKRCITATDSGLGMALGSLFVKKAFAQNSHAEANNLVENVRNAFDETMQTLTWMDSDTKKAAMKKVKGIFQKIGYPKYILDPKKLDDHYKHLEDLSEKEYFCNNMKILKFEELQQWKSLRKSVDRKKWYMTPTTINAYYDPHNNQIVFPAGILQPPFFKSNFPKAVNFGSMGTVIGHEITHGFDNNGRLYDAKGNYHGKGHSWWSQSSVDEFNKLKTCFANQYSNFTVAGQHIKGNVTLGENIADNGGLKAAYKAYKNWVHTNGEEKKLPGLHYNNDQIFFISFAQSWCTEELNSRLSKQIETDVHSPAVERVHGSIANNKDFARIFNCPLNSNMNPAKKCAIWG